MLVDGGAGLCIIVVCHVVNEPKWGDCGMSLDISANRVCKVIFHFESHF